MTTASLASTRHSLDARANAELSSYRNPPRLAIDLSGLAGSTDEPLAPSPSLVTAPSPSGTTNAPDCGSSDSASPSSKKELKQMFSSNRRHRGQDQQGHGRPRDFTSDGGADPIAATAASSSPVATAAASRAAAADDDPTRAATASKPSAGRSSSSFRAVRMNFSRKIAAADAAQLDKSTSHHHHHHAHHHHRQLASPPPLEPPHGAHGSGSLSSIFARIKSPMRLLSTLSVGGLKSPVESLASAPCSPPPLALSCVGDVTPPLPSPSCQQQQHNPNGAAGSVKRSSSVAASRTLTRGVGSNSVAASSGGTGDVRNYRNAAASATAALAAVSVASNTVAAGFGSGSGCRAVAPVEASGDDDTAAVAKSSGSLNGGHTAAAQRRLLQAVVAAACQTDKDGAAAAATTTTVTVAMSRFNSCPAPRVPCVLSAGPARPHHAAPDPAAGGGAAGTSGSSAAGDASLQGSSMLHNGSAEDGRNSYWSAMHTTGSDGVSGSGGGGDNSAQADYFATDTPQIPQIPLLPSAVPPSSTPVPAHYQHYGSNSYKVIAVAAAHEAAAASISTRAATASDGAPHQQQHPSNRNGGGGGGSGCYGMHGKPARIYDSLWRGVTRSAAAAAAAAAAEAGDAAGIAASSGLGPGRNGSSSGRAGGAAAAASIGAGAVGDTGDYTSLLLSACVLTPLDEEEDDEDSGYAAARSAAAAGRVAAGTMSQLAAAATAVPGAATAAASEPCTAPASAAPPPSEVHLAGATAATAAKAAAATVATAAVAVTSSTTGTPGATAADAGQHQEEGEGGAALLAMNDAVPPTMPRRTWDLSDYDITKRIYKGALSCVYRATCRKSGLPVALKVYFMARVPANTLHMLRREIELHIGLAHKNIIMLYAAFHDSKHLVLVQEWAERGDLFGVHRRMKCRLTETQTTELLLAPFLDALASLHRRGIVHRDIKPENILYTQGWTLKIADFGVSICLRDERAVTRAGTVEYMAPEVERCPLKRTSHENKYNPSLAYTASADIWSVGVLAYEMLVGFLPFVSEANEMPPKAGGDGVAVAAFMAAEANTRALSFPSSLSEPARDFIRAALSENPCDRPTVEQLLQHPWIVPALEKHERLRARMT
ncbi:hypothetical protein CHLRE_04g228208v5 [Chlamydomonas reinhardtii]|uniref:Protein kinase domain-containing protein n=1 Tax=Chlamydomonas reinhardtii TaxID=3055 RepID=A0A2K3DUU2_CHLRE|nr:uncharacterized protein CHLRE_04g228208v5 [Chlamydomonas reinhardtii]PNW84284.1 hypothetical protein CHLRE_04g228208v5 [Chlamydomonas reinhardtii]